MTFDEIMRELESLGTEQNRKIYQRHGSGPNLFGVSFANIDKLAKRIKRDQPLAEQLWKTGNSDAQTLATKIADPAAFTEPQLEQWIADCSYHGIVDQFVTNIVVKSSYADEKAKKWRKSNDEWVGRAGWILVGLSAQSQNGVSNELYVKLLGEIERTIHNEPNRKREAMLTGLIAIGTRNDVLEQIAISTAKRIGKVEIDHGDTSCKTPDAIAYIKKTRAHIAARSATK